MIHRTLFFATVTALVVSACANNPKAWQPPQLTRPTPQQRRLALLPQPGAKVAVAVYGFTDQTGQFKPSDSVQTLSRAVTQGATSILVKALQDAGNRQFFTVIEREKLDNVLRERAVIREMRSSYLGERQLNRDALPPLLFAGVLLEGGVIGYDSNTMTGGAGARFLGVGGDTKYREDTVTIYLRAVSTKTGEVLSSVSVRKSIASVALNGDAFRYVAFKDLLEAEGGITFNEPSQLALTQAVEKAVYALIAEGALQNLWCFRATAAASAEILTDYIAERDRVGKGAAMLPTTSDGQPITGACRSPTQAAGLAPMPMVSPPAEPRPPASAPASTGAQVASVPDRRPTAPVSSAAAVPARRADKPPNGEKTPTGS